MSPLPPQRVLITGGAGFVGSRIAHSILSAYPHWTVIISDIVPSEAYNHDRCLALIPHTTPSSSEYVHLDVTSPKSCLDALQSAHPDIVVHTAGVVPGGLVRYGRTARDRVNALNVGGTQNVTDAVRKCGIRFLVYTSSCTAITDDADHDFPNYNEDTPYPKTSLIYGASKAVAERLVLAANTSTSQSRLADHPSKASKSPSSSSFSSSTATLTNDSTSLYTTALRPSTVFGERDYQLIPSIATCILKHETYFLIGDGHNLYDFTYVDNIAHAHLLAINNLLHFHHPLPAFQSMHTGRSSAAGLAINISNDAPITFRDFCLAVWAEYGHYPAFTVPVPRKLAFVAGYLAEWYGWIVGGRTTLCRGSVRDAVGTRYADVSRARELLGYEPVVGLQEGIKRSVEALRKGEARPGDAGKRNRAVGFGKAEFG